MNDSSSLQKIGRQFTLRYYLGMGTITFIATGIHFLFFTLSKNTPDDAFIRLGFNIFIFGFVNAIGLIHLLKPVKKFFIGKVSFRESAPVIENLPESGTKWILILSFAYSMIAVTNVTLNNIPNGFFQIIPTLFSIIVIYIVFPSFFTSFYLQSIVMALKKSLSFYCDIQFEPQKKSIWKRVIIILIVLALIPQLLSLSYILFGFHNGLSPESIQQFRAIFVSAIVCSTIGIAASSVFIARWFRFPVQNLLGSIESVRNGELDKKAPVLSDDEIGILTAEFNNMVQGIREREFIRETFGKYLSKNIAELIIDKKINLSGELRLVTILTTDIEGYTGISERLTPHEVVSMLSEYFTDLVTVVNRYDGMVNKFIGDAIVALFNVPIDDPDHACKAVLTAKEIQNITQHKRYHGNIILKTRIGINTGLVVAGNIGSLERHDYTVIGDEVNIASRLEALNKIFDSSILIGQNTYELVKNNFNCTSMGDHLLKGKSSPLEVFRIEPH